MVIVYQDVHLIFYDERNYSHTQVEVAWDIVESNFQLPASVVLDKLSSFSYK